MVSESVSTAPGKVIMFGEHFVVHGSRAVLCAIDRRITVTSRTTDRPVFSVRSGFGFANHQMGASRKSIEAWVRPFWHTAREIRGSLRSGGLSITIGSSIPSGAGLGSSSACCVAAAGSVTGLTGPCTRRSLLNLAISSERAIYPDSSGADCTISVYGGVAEYRAGNFRRRNALPGMALVVANSDMRHSTAGMVAGVGRFRRKHPRRFESLQARADELAGRALSAMDADDVPSIGRLASENQMLLEEIGVSNDTLREMIRVADRHSYGSKITGAGGGGCIFAVTDSTNVSATVHDLSSAGYDTFVARIDQAGVTSNCLDG